MSRCKICGGIEKKIQNDKGYTIWCCDNDCYRESIEIDDYIDGILEIENASKTTNKHAII